MKKGFTLIELLAVIVILAIIALIATPIILGIINDARKESHERSVELYASAVRNAVASHQLTNPTAPTKFSDLDIQYDGEVECATEELYADGSFYIAECTVNGTEVEYTYGEQQELPSTQVYKPQYYSRTNEGGTVGGALPSDAKATVEELNPSKPFYLGLDVDANNKVITAYVCFTRSEIEYCLKGYDTEAFVTNTEIIKEAFGESGCLFRDDESECSTDDLNVRAYPGGYVDVNEYGPYCSVGSNGYFECLGE